MVGLPVFLLHWWLVQRGASKDFVERSVTCRAVFLHGVLAVTLVPVVQNTLTLANRLLLVAFELDPWLAITGGEQSLSDNLIAVVVNALVALYFFLVLRDYWHQPLKGEIFPEVRRLYRYLWIVYSLAFVVGGSQQTLQFILKVSGTHRGEALTHLANGLALLLVGTPIWVYAWRIIQQSLGEPAEQQSFLRLVV